MALISDVRTAGAVAKAGRAMVARGVLLGRDFDADPPPPARDVLAAPLVLPKLPKLDFPEEGLGERLDTFLSAIGLGGGGSERRLQRKAREMIRAIVVGVSGNGRRGRDAGGGFGRKPGAARWQVRVRHPYNLRPAFEMLVSLPDAHVLERRALELLLALILRRYEEALSEAIGRTFRFENEAREYFHSAFKIERIAKKMPDQNERAAALKNLYDSYYHGKNYYLYSLIARDKGENDGRMFMNYCRACYHIARTDLNGALLERANRRRLPARRVVLFHFRRDRSALLRARTDIDFANQLRQITAMFPA
jgi:hypothetical protein